MINLDLSFLGNYFFLKKDYDKLPELHDKLSTVLGFLNPNSCCRGVIEDIDLCGESDRVIVTCPLDEESAINDKRVLLVLLDDGYLWGKFNCLYNLISHNLIRNISDFRIDQWKEYIRIHGRRFENKARKRFITDSCYLARFSQKGLLRYFPVIRSGGGWKTRDYIFGHPAGYPKDYVRADLGLAAKVNQVISRLSDARSKETYRTVMFGNPSELWRQYFRNLLNNPQYFDYVQLNDDSVVINAGVENGFEIPYFLSFDVSQIFNIDPSGKDFLNDHAKEWCQSFPERLTFIKKILYQIECGDDDGAYQKTTLTEVIEEHQIKRVDLIKSDIEGAERNMSKEIQPIIDRFRPQLAISIYHTVHSEGGVSLADMADMPLQLMEKCKDYNFYIGCYSYERWETILYCIPKEIDPN